MQATRKRTARPKTEAQLATAYPVTIVIPAHNAAHHLERSLPALASNQLTNCEVLIVDDASTDGTHAAAESWRDRLPLQVVTLTRQSGPAGARNAGLREASHPYVFFLDADVVLNPDALLWVRESLDVYNHRPEIAGVLGMYAEELPTEDFFSNYKNLYTCHLYEVTETLSPFIHTPIFCVRAELLNSVGGFDTRLATVEDFRLGVVLGSQGHRFVIDRRVRGVHLKRYTFGSILRENRRRIRDLKKIELDPGQRRFYYRAHRWSRLLSLGLPGLTLLALLGSWYRPQLLWAALAMAVLFGVANRKLLSYCRRKRGILFALKSACFLFVEMLAAEWAIMTTR